MFNIHLHVRITNFTVLEKNNFLFNETVNDITYYNYQVKLVYNAFGQIANTISPCLASQSDNNTVFFTQ